MKKSKIIMTVTFSLLLTSACQYEYTKNHIYEEMKTKIEIVFNEDGLGDRSFNDLCYDGMLKAQEELKIEFDYSQGKNKEEYDDLFRKYASSKEYDLIIGHGEEQEDAINKVSEEYEEQKFTIIDSELKNKNVSAIDTKWAEQTFLNGVIAGLSISNNLDSTETVGIILGKNHEYLKEGAIGFEAGVRYINPNIDPIIANVNDFSNPAKAKEIAILMYQKGAKYIQQIAGESGFGVFAAAKQTDNYAFGVDGNQNIFEPDYIVSTAIRYVDKIVYDEIKSVIDNTWEPGVHKLGLKDDIIGYTREGSNVELDSKIIEIVEDIKESIINGEIEIPSTKKQLEVWVKQNNYKY